jgi:hypothetical protein
MPFDPTGLRRSTVTVLPPTPPERSDRGGPHRVHVVIEIIDQRPRQQPRGYRFGTLTLWVLVIALLAALAGCTAAQAQPTSWQSYQQGFTRQYQGTDAAGGQWTGTSYRQGFTTYFDGYGPHGEQQHCRSYELSGTVHTECDR